MQVYMQVLLALCGTVLGVLLLLNALGGWVPSKLGSGHGVTSKLEVMEAALSWSPPVIIHNATDESPECVAKMKQWSTTWAKSHPTARPSALLHHAYPKSSMLESLSTMSIELDNRVCCCLALSCLGMRVRSDFQLQRKIPLLCNQQDIQCGVRKRAC